MASSPACLQMQRWFLAGGSRYQSQLGITCFADDKHPNEERYLISLEVSRPC
jgi:hypothetical protein